MPFLRQVTAGPQRSGRAAGRRGRALPALRRHLTDQRAEPGVALGARGRVRDGRDRSAAVLGQPQLAAVAHRHGGRDGGRRRAASARAGHQCHRRVLRVPPVPGEPGRGPASKWARRHRNWSSCGTSSTIPGFIAANVDRVQEALSGLSAGQADVARLVFTAHSIPSSADANAGPEGGLYSTQQRETARLIAEAVRGPGAEFDLVWQSRSGPPQVPWLGPDINDHLRALAVGGGVGRRRHPLRLRLGPPRGAVGSGHRGPGDGSRTRYDPRPGRDRRHPSGLRRSDPRIGPGTPRRHGQTGDRSDGSVRGTSAPSTAAAACHSPSVRRNRSPRKSGSSRHWTAGAVRWPAQLDRLPPRDVCRYWTAL